MLKAGNTEKAGHNVKPRPPGKMCTFTSVVRSQHAIGQTMQRKRICIPRTRTIRPSWLVGVFIQRTEFVFYRTLNVVIEIVCKHNNNIMILSINNEVGHC